MIISGSVISQSSEYITGNSLFRDGSNQVSNINYRVYLNSQMTSLSSGCSGYSGYIYNGNTSIWNLAQNTIIVEPQWSESYADYKDGVTISDAQQIQLWSGTAPIGYKKIAADVDESGQIGVTDDYSAVIDLINGNITKFPSDLRTTTPSWLIFHDQSTSSSPYPDDAVNAPGNQPTKSFTNIYGNTIWQFNGLYFDYRLTKMGDCSASTGGSGNSWVCGSYSLTNSETSNRNEGQKTYVKKGSIIEAAVYLEGTDKVYALQLPIDFEENDFKLKAIRFGEGFYPKWNYNKYTRELTVLALNDDLSPIKVNYGKDLITFTLETLRDIDDLDDAIKWSEKTEIEMNKADITAADSKAVLEIRSVIPPNTQLKVFGRAGNLTAEINSSLEGTHILNIYNSVGQQVLSQAIHISKGLQLFDLPNLMESGIYIAQLQRGRENISTKFLLTN